MVFVALPIAILQAVIDKKISRDAGWLYAALLSHLNQKRGGNTVWPSRATIAAEMGISKAANVDKYLAELLNAGFILIQHQRTGSGMKTRNIYTMLVQPGLRSPEVGTSGSPAETDETPGQDVVPKSGLRSPEVGTQVVPKSGPELEEEELEERSSSRGVSVRDRIVAITDATDDEVDLIIEEIRGAAARPIKSLGAYMAKLSEEDIRQHCEAVRLGSAERSAVKRKADLADLHRWVKTLPACDHGTAGGWFPHPDSGAPWQCPICRRAAERDPDTYAEQLEELKGRNGL